MAVYAIWPPVYGHPYNMAIYPSGVSIPAHKQPACAHADTHTPTCTHAGEARTHKAVTHTLMQNARTFSSMPSLDGSVWLIMLLGVNLESCPTKVFSQLVSLLLLEILLQLSRQQLPRARLGMFQRFTELRILGRYLRLLCPHRGCTHIYCMHIYCVRVHEHASVRACVRARARALMGVSA